MLCCRLIYMLSMLYVRLTIKVKVGIPESFKVGRYPHKITGSSHLNSNWGHVETKNRSNPLWNCTLTFFLSKDVKSVYKLTGEKLLKARSSFLFSPRRAPYIFLFVCLLVCLFFYSVYVCFLVFLSFFCDVVAISTYCIPGTHWVLRYHSLNCLRLKQVLLSTKKTIRLRMIWPLIQASLGMLRRLSVIRRFNRSLILTITTQKYLLKVLIILTLHMLKLISNVIKFCCCLCCCCCQFVCLSSVIATQ